MTAHTRHITVDGEVVEDLDPSRPVGLRQAANRVAPRRVHPLQVLVVHELGAAEYARQVEEEWTDLKDSASTLTDEEMARVAAWFAPPAYETLARQQLRKLKIYAGSDHPHQAQRPEPLA